MYCQLGKILENFNPGNLVRYLCLQSQSVDNEEDGFPWWPSPSPTVGHTPLAASRISALFTHSGKNTLLKVELGTQEQTIQLEINIPINSVTTYL